jgi:hypothetical protein
MKKFLALLLALAVTLCGCAASTENPAPASSENPPSVSSENSLPASSENSAPASSSENPPAESAVSVPETDSIIPANYEGKTEFVADDGEILLLEDASSIIEWYTSEWEDGTHTVFGVFYDFAWFRESTGISYNSVDNPEYFNIPEREYTGPNLDPAELQFHKVKAGDTYKGYRIKEATTIYKNLSGYCYSSKVVFEGEMTLKGRFSFFVDMLSKPKVTTDLLRFHPFAKGNAFLPIQAMYGGRSLQGSWSDDYAYVEDSNDSAYVTDFPDSFVASLIETNSIDDSVAAALKDRESVDAEITVTELTMQVDEGSSYGIRFKVKSVRALS